jgi:hypothetical protein
MAPGTYRNASGRMEWVLSPDATQHAESIVGGRLTQQNMIAAMISGRGGGSSSETTYHDGRRISLNGMTAQDRNAIRTMINRTLDERFKREF